MSGHAYESSASDQAHAEIKVSDFDFELPEELIAQQPPAVRGGSRMLVIDRRQPVASSLTDSTFADLPRLLNPGDLLVLNDSRVIPARLFARRANARGKQEPSGQIEVLLTSPAALEGATRGRQSWHCLVRPGRKVRLGDRLVFEEASGAVALEAQVIAAGEFGARTILFEPANEFYAALDRIGHMPLPPYIHRSDAIPDRERYQTVFAAQRGSVAAPTAGLHFTDSILEKIRERGVEIARVTLHVGLGTFAPLRVELLSEIRLHAERYTLSDETAAALDSARVQSRRIVAVGTTVVRTLEHCALAAEQAGRPELEAHSGETSIFLSPGHRFRMVGAMLTNFHLPQSSLLMLVSAFAGNEDGRERTLAAYQHAVAERYSFFSYGDCMFLA